MAFCVHSNTKIYMRNSTTKQMNWLAERRRNKKQQSKTNRYFIEMNWKQFAHAKYDH